MARFINFRILGRKLEVFVICKRFDIHRCSSHVASLTQQEVVAALRPFYFAVHPDLFWQFPTEKEINENSLKLLNSYLETLLKNQQASPTSLTFCLRNSVRKVDSNPSFKRVSIQLLGRDLRNTVRNILSTCQLPTHSLDNITVPKQEQKLKEDVAKDFTNASEKQRQDPDGSMWWKVHATAQEIEERIRNEPDIDFGTWLNKNVPESLRRQRACQPLREETERLCSELKNSLLLKDVLWNCGWGITHFRGCLLSFRGLALQHQDDMKVLKDRTIIFGKQTGMSFEGHIILSCEDVRNNWLDVISDALKKERMMQMIHAVDQYDSLLKQVPAAEKALSDVLRGITIDHRKFQPTVMVQKYIQQLGKLTSAIYKYKWCNGCPSTWPMRLEKFQLVVECEAGPLMLSPTGQFIVPASCPAFLLVDFISKNIAEASRRLEKYTKMKLRESEVYAKCMSHLGLSSLEKDDNVTPDLMVQCCERLLEESSKFGMNLRDLRLRVSHYYSVLQDGDICIPWDWKDLSS